MAIAVLQFESQYLYCMLENNGEYASFLDCNKLYEEKDFEIMRKFTDTELWPLIERRDFAAMNLALQVDEFFTSRIQIAFITLV